VADCCNLRPGNAASACWITAPRHTCCTTAAACPTCRLLLAGGPVAALPHFSPGLVMEMRAQGLSEEDAIAALETCDGDGEKVCFKRKVCLHLQNPTTAVFCPLADSASLALHGMRLVCSAAAETPIDDSPNFWQAHSTVLLLVQ